MTIASGTNLPHLSVDLSLNRSYVRSRGRTLIELIVAMALSLLILLGVGSLFLGANQSSRTASGVSGAEEGGAMVMSLLGNAIRRAGYSEIIGKNVSPSGTRNNLLYSGPNIRGCVNVGINDLAAGTCGGPPVTTGDVLAIWFQADNVLAAPQGLTNDCVGLPPSLPYPQIVDPGFRGSIPGGAVPVVANQYYVAGNALVCFGNDGGVARELVRNVVDFRVYYGFDDVAYAAAGTASAVPSERPAARSIHNTVAINAMAPMGGISPWEFVVSAHVCVVVRTEETGVTTGANYTPCPATEAEAAGINQIVPIAPPAGELGAIRRSYTEVFTVRSRAAPTPATPI